MKERKLAVLWGVSGILIAAAFWLWAWNPTTGPGEPEIVADGTGEPADRWAAEGALPLHGASDADRGTDLVDEAAASAVSGPDETENPCLEPNAGFPCGRPSIYVESGFGSESHPYQYESEDTLMALADTGDGVAHWHLAMRLAPTDLAAAKYHALAASVFLGSGEPIVFLVENYIAGTDQRDEALPYLLLALELGASQGRARWASQDDIDASRGKLAELRDTAQLLVEGREGGER